MLSLNSSFKVNIYNTNELLYKKNLLKSPYNNNEETLSTYFLVKITVDLRENSNCLIIKKLQ